MNSSTSTAATKVNKDDFKIVKVIGRGAFGKVYLVSHLPTGKVYAMKSIKKEIVLKSN
jgi:serine/threonine protein kinase